MLNKNAFLALEDGTVFKGVSRGAEGHVVAEVVFNTSITGYQEILTDPSYSGQIVTMTYPHIGNTGINLEDNESDRAYAEGLVIRDMSMIASNWRCKTTLEDYLVSQNKIAISDIDTRHLVSILREKGVQNGCLVAGDKISESEAVILARKSPGLSGVDLAEKVSTLHPYEWNQQEWELSSNSFSKLTKAKYNIITLDFGVKHNILRILASCSCNVTVMPAKTTIQEILDKKPDGVFLSNGPGDPAACSYAIDTIKKLLEAKIPLFGICLGHQLLALASGAKTKKMKFGHHGANHPVKDLKTGKVLITSQNHNFTVDESTLPDNLKATHLSLFDGTLQGLERTDTPAFGFQGHPEANPGPHDVKYLFNRFVKIINEKPSS